VHYYRRPESDTGHWHYPSGKRKHDARPDIINEHPPQQAVLRTTAAIVARKPASDCNCEQARASDAAHNERLRRRSFDTEQEPNDQGRQAQQRQTSASLNESGRDEQIPL
jgi:hypothetical protein